MIELPALVPENPCGYMAALGALKILSQRKDVSLSFGGRYAEQSAVLHCDGNLDDLVDELCELQDAKWLPTAKDITKLLPGTPPQWIGRSDHVWRRGTNEGKLIPTAWRTYGVKERKGWLEAVRDVAKAVTRDSYHSAFTEWNQLDDASPLGFDPSSFQDSAKQSKDAAGTGQLATAGAIWLAVNALPLFPTFPGDRLVTAGLWDGSFVYPTWTEPLGIESIRAICRSPIQKMDRDHLAAYGITTLWCSEIIPQGERRQLTRGVPI